MAKSVRKKREKKHNWQISDTCIGIPEESYENENSFNFKSVVSNLKLAKMSN